MNWKIIFNPFLKFSEWTLLIIGIVSFIIGSCSAAFFNVSYDGVLDGHIKETTLVKSLTENLINVALIFVGLLIVGKIINKKTRVIDVLNVALIYRIPIYLTTLIVGNSYFKNISDELTKNISEGNLNIDAASYAFIIISSMVLIPILIYSIVLLVNGFKTAVHVKRWQNYIAFTIMLIAAELISKILIQTL